MTCTKPLDGFRLKGGTVAVVKRGTRAPSNASTGIRMSIPCSKCIGCKMERARQWGIRCLHEAKMWPYNSYVTLTYSDENLPPGGSLELRDVQLFMKRLRFKRGANKHNPIRFFLGAEYGEQNGRPHYHALLFNCGFHDKLHHTTNSSGQKLYTSAELSSLWSVDGSPLGFCTVGDVTYDSAVYCAKYALKKVTGKPAEDHYCVYDENGECFDRRPEFALMSRRPGIGALYWYRYGKEVLDWDNVIVDGQACKPPRYYDQLFDKVLQHDANNLLCKCKMCANKRLRKREAVRNSADNTDERLAVKEKIMTIEASKKERKL